MTISEIVQQLKQERSKLDAAIEALEGGAQTAGASQQKRKGRPLGSGSTSGGSGAKGAHKRTMSPEARAAIGAAAKRRWAKWRREGRA
ncbi:MAG: hypothetical protein H0X25_19545 [Acidobacteriales bacterium]|nr:hypothetical protein [Terriglobales bacterium]